MVGELVFVRTNVRAGGGMRTNVRAYTRSTNKRSGRVPVGEAETFGGAGLCFTWNTNGCSGGRTGVR